MNEATKLAVVPQRTSAITPMEMLAKAVDQGADLDKLTKLMDLQERWEKNEARKAFITAKAAFYREAPKITKNKHVVHNDFWHATLDHIVEQVAPVLAKHGLTHSWSTAQDDKAITVACILTHELGHSEQVSLRAAADMSGSKNAVQGVGSTITYLERYTFLAVTGLAAKNEDKDGRNNADFVTTDQADTLQAVAEEVGANIPAFLKFYGAESFATIPAAKYKNALAALEKKRTAK